MCIIVLVGTCWALLSFWILGRWENCQWGVGGSKQAKRPPRRLTDCLNGCKLIEETLHFIKALMEKLITDQPSVLSGVSCWYLFHVYLIGSFQERQRLYPGGYSFRWLTIFYLQLMLWINQQESFVTAIWWSNIFCEVFTSHCYHIIYHKVFAVKFFSSHILIFAHIQADAPGSLSLARPLVYVCVWVCAWSLVFIMQVHVMRSKASQQCLCEGHGQSLAQLQSS